MKCFISTLMTCAIFAWGCSDAGFSGAGKTKRAEKAQDAAPAQQAVVPPVDSTKSDPPNSSATPDPKTTTPDPVDIPGVTRVNLSSCARHAACALSGTAPGRYHATMALSSTTIRAGDVIEMSYQSMPGLSGDWITVVPVDYEDNSWCAWFWSGGPTGSFKFNGLPAGQYELRAYYGWKAVGECEVIGRLRLTISP